MNAMLGGHIDLTDSNLTQKGKVDAGSSSSSPSRTDKRSPKLPNVPTLKELGVNVIYAVNRGLMAPKGTPRRRPGEARRGVRRGGQGAGVRAMR